MVLGIIQVMTPIYEVLGIIQVMRLVPGLETRLIKDLGIFLQGLWVTFSYDYLGPNCRI